MENSRVMAISKGNASPRILQVLVPGPAGGLESVVHMLARGLRDAGVPVAVSAVVEPGHALPPSLVAIQDAGLEVFCHAPAHRAYLRERRLHRDTIMRWGAEVVHTHGYRADLLAGSAAQSLGRAQVTTVHGFTGGDWKNRLYERLQLRAFRHFDAVIAVAGPVRDRLVASGLAASPITVLPNAWASTAPPLDRAAARAALGLAADAIVVGWVGRLSPEKGADVLLEAIARMGRLDLTVSFIGDGAARTTLVDQASRLGLSDRVRWHGLVPEAARLYPAFDCFVLSSRTEGTPIALFEAMAAGVPVVATRVGGVPDVVSEAEAMLVPSEQPAALAEAIAGVLGAPTDAARRSAQARLRLAQRYAPGPWLERHLALYRTVLAHRRGEAA